MIMIAKTEWVPVGKNFVHPFVYRFFLIVLMENYREKKAENYVFYKLEKFFKPIASSIRICEEKWQFLKNVKNHFFLLISYKTLNVPEKDSKIEKINVTMIMVAKIEWVHVGKTFVHLFVKNLFFKIVLMENYRDKRPKITFYTNLKYFSNQSQVR